MSLYKKKIIIRNFKHKSFVHLKFFNDVVVYYRLHLDYSLANLATAYSLLKLIINKVPYIIRAKKSSALKKVKRGAPIGVMCNLNKETKKNLLLRFAYEILPQQSSLKTLNFTPNKEQTFVLSLNDPFLFTELQQFYFIFNNFNNLKLMFKLNTKIVTIKNLFFLLSLEEFPV